MAGAALAVKPAPFDYAAPRSVDEALELLAGGDAVALAGGQSLVPMMNLRLAQPARVVDLNGVEELSHVRVQDGALRIGAMARQAAVERSEVVSAGWPLLAHALRFVGHVATRSRGTVGGSVAHADPRAELPVALLALGARFHVRGPRGARVVAAGEMFRGPMTTALAEGELLCEIEVPAAGVGARMAFVEHSRTAGDFALAGVAVVVVPGVDAAVALLGAGPAPVRDGAVERAVVAGAGAREAAGAAGALGAAGAAGALGAAGAASPVAAVADPYRRALLQELVARALEAALP